MRLGKTTSSVAAALALSSLSAFAQQAPGSIGGPPPTVTAPPPITGVAPSEGTPWFPGTTTGLDKVGEDGISTKTVKAIPCSTAARGTDGFTTCIGIPDERARARRTQ